MADKKIAVIGAGLMGNGIAQVSIMAGYEVVLVDIKDEFVDKGYANIEVGIKKLEAKGKLGEGVSAADVMARCSKSIDLASAVKDVDIVVEAVIEKMDIKKQVSKTVMDNGPSHIIFASNTSTMSITEIGKDCGAPDRVCGLHFFNPVPLMRLVEVIRSDSSSDETINIITEYAQALPCLRGKRFIAEVLKDRPGFIVNRLNAPAQIYMNWVFDTAAEKGIPWEQIEGDAGNLMPMGPCVLTDYVGIDTAVHTQRYYAETLSPDFAPGKVVSKFMEEGNLGAKTGKGFFDWSQGRPNPDKSVKAGLFSIENTMAILLNEGCRILDEGIAAGYKVIDDANMAGMNTPGPFGAGKNAYEKWSAMLEKLADETGKEYLRPCELMKSGGFIKMRK
jgi:enoyl-CoA hydratase/3-hydroxyacyl-CoA dehydrogenase